jgi:phosphoribosylanthranilate isomerase
VRVVKPRVKICGVRRAEDALLACGLGADAIGFVFWPGSPRFVDPECARAIVSRLPAFVSIVGVFVNQEAAYIADVMAVVPLTAVQLHGDESPESYQHLRTRVIKSVAVHADFDAARAHETLPLKWTMLLDAHDPIRRGGTGRTVDWHAAEAVARRRPVILSGGLHAGNVAEAIARVCPYAVDVSSGVESAPGVKDPERLRDLFAALNPEP